MRARVRAAKKYLSWLAVSADVAFPDTGRSPHGLLGQPAVGALQQGRSHGSTPVYGVAGVEEKLTTNALYTLVYRELLSTDQPGRVPKLTLRYPATALESLETLVLEEGAAFYLRVYSWWVLLQCWDTLRFADHRGLSPGDGERKRTHGEACPLEDHRGRQGAFTQTRGNLGVMLHQETRLVVVWLAPPQHEGGFSEGPLAPCALGESQGLPAS